MTIPVRFNTQSRPPTPWISFRRGFEGLRIRDRRLLDEREIANSPTSTSVLQEQVANSLHRVPRSQVLKRDAIAALLSSTTDRIRRAALALIPQLAPE
jgi:hypothetical protein